MTRTIPARIENGQVVADEPLPEPGDVERVRIVVELVDRPTEADIEARVAAMAQLLDAHKGVSVPADYDYKEDYANYLAEKYR